MDSWLAPSARPGMTVKVMTASLKDFSGTLVLVGAGKMGGAMLEGWLALGLDPVKIAIMEPKPSDGIAALTARGVRLNPSSVNDASVIVIAIKPQDAATVVPTLKPLAGGVEVAGRQCEALLDSALDTSERYFQAFQFVVWAGKSATEALDAILFETSGEA